MSTSCVSQNELQNTTIVINQIELQHNRKKAPAHYAAVTIKVT